MEYIMAIITVTILLIIILMLWALCLAKKIYNEVGKYDLRIENEKCKKNNN